MITERGNILDKKSLRKNMISVLSCMDEGAKNEKEDVLKEKFIDFIKEHDIRSIGIVLSMPHELDTDGIVSWMVESGREVYTPVCDYREKEMNFSRFFSFDDVVTDEKNLRVPSERSNVNNQVDLIVVPGLIYSETGYRIGYGGGFYDRFLKDYSGVKLSLLFEEQIGEAVREPHDVPVDILITPERTIDAKSRRSGDEK
ncbi:5-formyltetrahydrofolate cyclo-ligase [Salinicoccus carnicancri]|uniref:5-formyltetrahydrofolate cyclo-ligase n=1 Tax=Salinicoccus carnicancri TaxID=558170 RepID=UPI00247FCFAF|nr:5-formyltetrahydrofolate cyclo-ligase [Salinicoccus carnicancri]